MECSEVMDWKLKQILPPLLTNAFSGFVIIYTGEDTLTHCTLCLSCHNINVPWSRHKESPKLGYCDKIKNKSLEPYKCLAYF